MAYPTINSPYGFQPVNRYDGIRTPGQLYRSQSALRTILQSITVLQLKSYRTVQLNYQALQLPVLLSVLQPASNTLIQQVKQFKLNTTQVLALLTLSLT
jgi:hypothetical protein